MWRPCRPDPAVPWRRPCRCRWRRHIARRRCRPDAAGDRRGGRDDVRAIDRGRGCRRIGQCLNAAETLAVGCGSAEASAWRALMAATCAGVACFGVAGASPQKPRALMMSAGVCGFASAFWPSPRPASAFAGCTICASAEASWKVAAGFARGIGTASADLAGAAVAIRLAGAVFSETAAAPAPSSSSSFDLPLNRAANRLGLLNRRGVVAAALFDLGAGKLIALQRVAVGGNMHGAAVREYADQLIVGHARPVTDAAGIEMDEGRSRCRIESDAAALQAEPGEADLLKRHVRNVEIHGVAQHVLAEARHARRTAAEHGVGGGGAVGGNDLDRLLAVDVAVDFPEDVEQMTIHRGLFLAAPVAEIVIELFQRLFVVTPVALEGDGEVFIGMGVVERKGAGFVQRGRIMDRSGSRQEQQGCQAEMIPGLRQRQRIELACETSQHV